MDKRFEYYKEQYYFELNRKNELTNSLVIPIGFITAVFTGYAYFFLQELKCGNTCLLIFYYGFLFVSLYFTIKALFNLFQSIRDLKYGYTPDINELYNFENLYMKYNKGQNKPIDENLDEKFFENLKGSLVRTTHKNSENNNYRSEKILHTNINIIYAVFFLFISTVFFILNSYFYIN